MSAPMASVRAARLPVWIILGPPGSGKGTYAQLLAKRFGLAHISTGDLARQAAKDVKQTELRRLMGSGSLLPDVLIINLLRGHLEVLAADLRQEQERLQECLQERRALGDLPFTDFGPFGPSRSAVVRGVLLDGFPRTLEQAELLQQELQPATIALRIHLSDKHILAKIDGRRVCQQCWRGYNVVDVSDHEEGVFMPPLLPEGVASSPALRTASELRCSCGGSAMRRGDDAPHVAQGRLQRHHATEGPVAGFFARQGVLLEHRVRRGIEDIEDLVSRIQAALGGRASAPASGSTARQEARL